MDDASDLTLAFLQDRPAEAARTLGEVSGEDVASFIENVPAKITAPVIALMVPWKAAACLEAAPPATGAAQLELMEYQSAMGVLRLMRPEIRESVLRSLPPGLSKKYQTSLSYPIDTVGALMDQSMPSFSKSARVEDALGYFKQSHVSEVHHIFLLDDNKKLHGAVSVAELIKNHNQADLNSVDIQNVPPVLSVARLSVVRNDAEWDEYPMRPVIDASRTMVGGLSRKALRKESSAHSQLHPATAPSLVANVFGMYLHCCQNLIGLTSQVDQIPASQKEGQ